MIDYVHITDTYMVAGDYDSRKRYLMQRAGASNPLAVCSGVTWSLGGGDSYDGSPMRAWRWQLGSRGNLRFEPGQLRADEPTPQRVTDCII